MPTNKRILDMTSEERREAGRNGGIKSGEAKRKKKAMKESLEVLLTLPLKKGKEIDIEEIRSYGALKGKNITVEQAMLIAQIQKALKGDTNALAFLRDTSGQKPENNINMTGALPVIITGEDALED